MKSHLSLILLLGSIALGGCASVETRISRHQSEFDSWPAEVQDKIRAGNIDLGFTPDQVRVALGEPDKIYSRKSAEKEEEIWAYFDSRGRFSFGVSVGSHGRGGAIGGVVRERQEDRLDDATRVVFEADKVVALESVIEK